ncbi:MAG: DUF3329 domain-containing protein [Rhizobiaceae bacterium]|nr:DUF3329 domain-containing protein [Rhizobiaceae bacterium]
MANNTSHPFLDPLWRRVVLIGACAAWCVVELLYGTPMWATLVGAVTVYGAYAYLYAYTPSSRNTDKEG